MHLHCLLLSSVYYSAMYMWSFASGQGIHAVTSGGSGSLGASNASSTRATASAVGLPATDLNFAKALEVCAAQNANRFFCAWIAATETTHTIAAVVCYSELEDRCVLGASKRYNYRRSSLDCLPCQPCASAYTAAAGLGACAGGCRVYCYCTCNYTRFGAAALPGIYQCSQMCNGRPNCPITAAPAFALSADESPAMCQLYRQRYYARTRVPVLRFSLFRLLLSMALLSVFVITVLSVLCFLRRKFPNFLRTTRSQWFVTADAPVVYQQQQQQQMEMQCQPPFPMQQIAPYPGAVQYSYYPGMQSQPPPQYPGVAYSQVPTHPLPPPSYPTAAGQQQPVMY